MSSEIVRTIDNRRALYVAALVHDIAKGARRGSFDRRRAHRARARPAAWGSTPSETETAAWLVEHHLAMSLFAQSRDLNDPKTLRDFAALVQSRERLKLLLLLTVADIRAVGPGVWTGWKGQLLRTLYFETEPLLGGGHTDADAAASAWPAPRMRLRARLGGWPKARPRALHRSPLPVLLAADRPRRRSPSTPSCIRDAEAQDEADRRPISPPTRSAASPRSRCSRRTIRACSPWSPAPAPAPAPISSMRRSRPRATAWRSTPSHLEREFDHAEDEERRAEKIAATIERLLTGEVRLADVVLTKRKPKPRLSAFTVEPQVVIDNTLSDALTVIEINGLDRPGLLYDVTREISDLNLDIASAHIATFGEKAVDVFYVTDLTGKKITSKSRESAIRERLLKALQARHDPALAARLMRLYRGFATVGAMTILSRVLGFVRDVLIAAVLGTSSVADAFFVAFRIPNMFRRLFAEGAFDAAFIPLFAKRLHADGPEAARAFAGQALSGLARPARRLHRARPRSPCRG